MAENNSEDKSAEEEDLDEVILPSCRGWRDLLITYFILN